jgi:integral membrane protein (TIGR01906 family)
MKKVLVVAIIAFFIANFATAIQLVAFDRGFFESFYQSNQTAEKLDMSFDDLMRATDHLLAYITGEKDDLELTVNVNNQPVMMYNQREIDHMVDVRDLFATLVVVQIISYLVFLLSILGSYLMNREKLKTVLFESSKLAVYVFGGAIGLITLFALVDFNWFWRVFHEVLFDNDLWLLNPLTDRMIVMVPLAFFKRLVAFVIGTWLLSVLLWLLLTRFISKRKLI